MPELPEIETICNGLQTISGNKIEQIFRSPKKLRIESKIDLSNLIGKRIRKISRRARYLLIELVDESNSNQDQKNIEKAAAILIIHLGMSGRLTLSQNFEPKKHDHFACKLNNINDLHHSEILISNSKNRNRKNAKKNDSQDFKSGSWLIFNDPRRFGFIDFIPKQEILHHKSFSSLGPEPLSLEFNARYLQQQLKRKTINIKTAMMDNKIVVGIGNIYINESLFLAGISPLRPSCELNLKEIEKLILAVRKTLEIAIEMGGSSISDYRNAEGEFGNFQTILKVYGRKGLTCLQCENLILKIQQNGRSSFFCKTCQH